VQRFGTDPAGVRRKPAYTFHEALNTLADGVVDVKGDEDAHKRRWSFAVGRWRKPLRLTTND
jgi:hypothetical protein